MSDKNGNRWGNELRKFLHDGNFNLPEGARLLVVQREEEHQPGNDNTTLIRFRAYDFTSEEVAIYANQFLMTIVRAEGRIYDEGIICSYNLKVFIDVMMRFYDKAFCKAKASE